MALEITETGKGVIISGLCERINGHYINAGEHAKLLNLSTKACKAKGRYHSQEAMCDLMDYLGMNNERFKKQQTVLHNTKYEG